MSDDELLRETHDAVMDIKSVLAERCPKMEARVDFIERTVDGNGEGLRSRMLVLEDRTVGILEKLRNNVKWMQALIVTMVTGLLTAIATAFKILGGQ